VAICRPISRREENVPQFYSLKRLGTPSPPKTFRELETWLTENGKYRKWDAKIYVAKSIRWEAKASEFQQRGCSPNYQAGWWSLACCKYDMRTARPFRDIAIDLTIPTYIFTLGKLEPELGQPLVSVAEVTEHSFRTMKEYFQFLLEQHNRGLTSSRSTCVRRNDGLFGWRFGDCHSDLSGKIGKPHQHHVHRRDDSWKNDCNGEHMILASDRFLLWPEPAFVAATTQKQSRYGTDIDPSTLRKLLKRHTCG